jgi:hypothetical protein
LTSEAADTYFPLGKGGGERQRKASIYIHEDDAVFGI